VDRALHADAWGWVRGLRSGRRRRARGRIAKTRGRRRAARAGGGRGADAPVRSAPQSCDIASLGKLEGRSMNSTMSTEATMNSRATTHRWGTIETAFATFAAWVDERGRLVRFNLSAKGAASVDRSAVHDERAIARVRKQV